MIMRLSRKYFFVQQKNPSEGDGVTKIDEDIKMCEISFTDEDIIN